MTTPLAAVIASAGGGASDPSFASVTALLHLDGADGSTTITDVKGNTWAAIASAVIATAQAKFGGSSLSVPGTGRAQTAATTPFAFGTGDFTVEFWARPASFPANNCFWFTTCADVASAGGIGIYSSPSSATLNVFDYTTNAVLISAASALTTGVWQHVALARQGTSMKLFINGTQAGSTATNSSSFTAPAVAVGGPQSGVGGAVNGHIDEVRVTKGVARYTANFTAPASAFPNR